MGERGGDESGAEGSGGREGKRGEGERGKGRRKREREEGRRGEWAEKVGRGRSITFLALPRCSVAAEEGVAGEGGQGERTYQGSRP